MAVSLRKSIPFVIAVMAVPAIPAIIFTIFGWGEASNIWMLGTITGALAILSSSWRVSAVTVALLALASTLAVLNQGNPWGSLVIMGVCAGISGIASVRGLVSAVNFFAISAAFFVAQPPVISTSLSTAQNALLVGAVALCSGLWGLAITGKVFHKIHFPPAAPLQPRHAIVMAVVLALLVGGTAWVVAERNLGHGGYWLMMTILIVVQPGISRTFKRSMQRAIGTVAGFVIAIILSAFVSTPILMLLSGVVLLGMALLVKMDSRREYWQYVLFLTPGVVLVVASNGDEGSLLDLAMSRLGYTVLGSIIGLITVACLLPFFRDAVGKPDVAPVKAS